MKYISVSVRSIILFCVAINATCSSCRKHTVEHPVKISGQTIIYTDLNPDTALTGFLPANIFNLDLNADGVTDFEISRETNKSVCDPIFMYYLTTINLSVKPANSNNAILTERSGQAPALDSSIAILPDLKWGTGQQVLLTWGRGDFRCVAAFRSSGLWANATDKYLALKFIKNDQVYYGWVRLTITINSTPNPQLRDVVLTIKDYAFNSIPNQPISAGQTR